MLSVENNRMKDFSIGTFQKIYDNWDLLEMFAISIIKNKEVNISNGRSLEIVNDFRNFIEAFPVLLKSDRIKAYLSRTKTNDVFHDYSKMMRCQYELSELVCVPTNTELSCILFGICKSS